MSTHVNDNVISDYPQTLLMFEDYKSEFLVHKTIYQTINLKTKARDSEDQDLIPSIEKLTPPTDILSLPKVDNSSSPDNELGEVAKNESRVEVSQSPLRQKSQSQYSATEHGNPHPVTEVEDEVSVRQAKEAKVEVKAEHVPSAKEKINILRRDYGLFPHSLSLSISDVQDVLSNEQPDFALQAILGQGGMGTVYQMLQTSLQRSVAMKVAKIDKWDLKKLAQHCHEAQISAYLSHTHIPPIHMLAHDVEGNPLIIMRKIEGVTWYDIIKDSQHSFWQNLDADIDQLEFHLDILDKIAQTLSYAHEQGIIHRDLKPTNVMVGKHGEVYLLDWGIALHLETAHSDDAETEFKAQRYSQLHEQILGSPAYMPAEMARADFHSQGPATDIYFLGANLFYLLTKKAIHQGDTLAGLLRNILTGRLTPIPDSLTIEMKNLISLSLVTDSAKRLSNAQEFLRLLRLARKAQKSRQLQVQGAKAYAELELLVSNNLRSLEKEFHCVESNLLEYIQMLEKYELAHRSYWAAYQIYNQNQQAFDGFKATLTLWLRRFLHLGEIQAARSVFAGIPNPSVDLKQEVESAWEKYLKNYRAHAVSVPEADETSARSQWLKPLLVSGMILMLIAAYLYGQKTVTDQVRPLAPKIDLNKSKSQVPNSNKIAHSVNQKSRQEQRVLKDSLAPVSLDSRAKIDSKDSLGADTSYHRKSSTNRSSAPSKAKSLSTLSSKTKAIKEQIVSPPNVSSTSTSVLVLPSTVYSYQIASIRQLEGALNYIKDLKIRFDLDQNDPNIGFWIKSIKLKSGKLVHRVMFGKFESPQKAKPYRKLIGKLKENVILRKLKD